MQLVLLAVSAAAQSSDPERPTPALSNEIAASIAPRDVGDSRRTRHFYAFGAQQGDLELTVESSNLEGDVDLFTAVTLRPLAKVTLLAGLGSGVTRTVFLRRAESLVLRVQARTPNDVEGSYRIRLGSTFIPAVAGPAETPEPSPVESASSLPRPAAGRRVTSTGARIYEPTPAPTPERAAAEPEATPEAAPATAGRTNARGRAGTRRGGTRAGSAGGRATRDAERPRDGTAERVEASPEPSSAPTPEAATPPGTSPRGTRARPTRGRAGSRTRGGSQTRPADAPDAAATAEPSAPAPTGLELPGTRLVLELREGGRVEREMSEVRRVTVERGQIVIVLKGGQVERQPLSNVLRMSIEP